jgi:hypothetical protein
MLRFLLLPFLLPSSNRFVNCNDDLSLLKTPAHSQKPNHKQNVVMRTPNRLTHSHYRQLSLTHSLTHLLTHSLTLLHHAFSEFLIKCKQSYKAIQVLFRDISFKLCIILHFKQCLVAKHVMHHNDRFGDLHNYH